MPKRVISCLLIGAFLCSFYPADLKAEVLTFSAARAPIAFEKPFMPVLMSGLKINTKDPFQFDFIFVTGDGHSKGQALKQESLKMIKYFMAGLTVPDHQLWVNLSPYEKNRIIPDALSHTDMGRDMLTQDYLLKQVSASLTNPSNTFL